MIFSDFLTLKELNVNNPSSTLPELREKPNFIDPTAFHSVCGRNSCSIFSGFTESIFMNYELIDKYELIEQPPSPNYKRL